MTRLLPLPAVLVLLTLTACTYAGSGTEHDDPATPTLGMPAPDFTLNDLNGLPQRLGDLADDGPVVLLVLRGYPGYQCPICTKQVGDYLAQADAFAKRGAKVVMVYPGPAEDLDAHAKEFIANQGLPQNFVFLTDPGYGFTDRYGLRWDAPRETAYPSTFVIRKGDRVIRHAHISHTHGDRTQPGDILAVLDGE